MLGDECAAVMDRCAPALGHGSTRSHAQCQCEHVEWACGKLQLEGPEALLLVPEVFHANSSRFRAAGSRAAAAGADRLCGHQARLHDTISALLPGEYAGRLHLLERLHQPVDHRVWRVLTFLRLFPHDLDTFCLHDQIFDKLFSLGTAFARHITHASSLPQALFDIYLRADTPVTGAREQWAATVKRMLNVTSA